MSNSANLITVSYTVNNQIVSFKAPAGTHFYGEEYRKDKGEPQKVCFNECERGNVDLGEISEEKHRLITGYRFADGNPELSKYDIQNLSKLSVAGELKGYIDSAEKGLAKCGYGNVQFNGELTDRVSSWVLNKQTNIEHGVQIILPKDSSIFNK